MASLVDYAANNTDKIVSTTLRKGYDGYPELTVEVRDRESYNALNETGFTVLNAECTASEALAEVTTWDKEEEE